MNPLLSRWRQHGLRGLCLRVLSGWDLYRSVRIFEASLEVSLPELPAIPGFQVSILSVSEMPEYLRAFPEVEVKPWAQGLPAGETCFVGRVDGQIVATRWARRRPFPFDYLGRPFRMGPRDVYIHSAFTSQRHRGRGYSAVLLSVLCCHFQQAGCVRALGVVVPDNENSERTLARLGFRWRRNEGYVRIGPWRWQFDRLR